MRLNSGEGNGVSLAGGTSRSIARIARKKCKALVCRSFLRAVHHAVIARNGRVPPYGPTA